MIDNARSQHSGALWFVLAVVLALLGTATPAAAQETVQSKDIHLVHVDRAHNIFVQHIPGPGLDLNVVVRETRNGKKIKWTATDDHLAPGTDRYPALAYTRIYSRHGGHYRSTWGRSKARSVTARQALQVARYLSEISPDCNPCQSSTFTCSDYGSLLVREAQRQQSTPEEE